MIKTLKFVTLAAVLLTGTAGTTLVNTQEVSASTSLYSVYPVSTSSGFIDVNGGRENQRVEAYVGSKRIGKDVLGKYGDGKVGIKPQKLGTVIKVYLLDSNGKRIATITHKVKKASKPIVKQSSIKKFQPAEERAINATMKKWADARAKKQRMAFTDLYFTHGAGGWGDWFADTTDGDVLEQDNNNPGYYSFKTHSLGGMVFYKPLDGTYGYSDDAHGNATFQDYEGMAKPGTTMVKYLFGDNGKVYEYKTTENKMSFASGFNEYSNEGHRTRPGFGKFVVSKDKELQKKYRSVLMKYKK